MYDDHDSDDYDDDEIQLVGALSGFFLTEPLGQKKYLTLPFIK
jgi:hypothetical protein